MGGSKDKTSTDDDAASSGLPVGAKIGIGVGVGVVGALGIVAIIIIMMRRRRYTPRGRQISDPMPGTGAEQGSKPPRLPPTFSEKNTSDLEMTARRYEDMLPRQQPRQMV